MSWTNDKAALREVARANVEAWLPSEPNATRRRRSGGSKNRHGELEGATVEDVQLRLFVTRRRFDRRDRSGIPLEAAEWMCSYLPEDDLIEPKDAIEYQGRIFDVIRVDRPSLDEELAFCRAWLKERV